MPDMPPLESIRAFEAAARHDSFLRAGQELDVTAATISHRGQALETHIGARLFSRHARGVRLNVRGREYAGEIRRIFAEITTATQRHRERPETTRLRRVAVEVVAEKWLKPRRAEFKAAGPDIASEVEKDHSGVAPDRGDCDVWSAGTDRVEETLHVKTRFEETRLPACSPAFLKADGKRRDPPDLRGWARRYGLQWKSSSRQRSRSRERKPASRGRNSRNGSNPKGRRRRRSSDPA